MTNQFTDGVRILLSDRNARIPSWSTEKLTRPRFDRNTVELRRYVGIEGQFSKEAISVVSRFANKSLAREAAMTEFREKLTTAETHTFIAGKRAAGQVTLRVLPDEKKMLDGRMSRNMRYFSNFLDDIEHKRTRMPIAKRADLYAKSLWSIYNRGQAKIDWADPQSGRRYFWILDWDAEHCDDCWKNYVDCERQGGFTFDELLERGFPGEKTACIVRCRCHLRVGSARRPYPKEPPPGGGEQEHVPESMRVGGMQQYMQHGQLLQQMLPEESALEPPLRVGGMQQYMQHGQLLQQMLPEESALEPPQMLIERIAKGDTSPVYFPAAGLPAVVAQPAVVSGLAMQYAKQQTVQSLDSAVDTYLRSVEGVLSPLLVRPRLLSQEGESTRIYVGNAGVKATVKRGPGGLWFLAALLLPWPDKKPTATAIGFEKVAA